MKNSIIIALLATLTLSYGQESTNVEACKTYIHEAKMFQNTMKHTKVDEATLAFHKDNVVSYCGQIANTLPYTENFFALDLMKKETASVDECKLAINMAKTYINSEHTTPFIVHAHKLHVADNCGSLVAKVSPSFCLFDVVENQKTQTKERCITSIEKAHASQNTEMLKHYKNDVVTYCGKLQTHI